MRAVPVALGLLGLLSTDPATAQTEPCTGPSHRQFDFWLGEWEVQQEILRPDGSWIELPARSTVRPAAGGCAVTEEWHGDVLFFWEGMSAAAPLDGSSVRAFDPDARLWRIWWLDSRRPDFGRPFEGRFENDEGVFLRTGVTADGAPLLTRIRFYDVTMDSVRWELAISRDAGLSWSTLWRMLFRRPAQSDAVITIRPNDGRIDGRRIRAYTNAWRSSRLTAGGERRQLAIWHDTVSVIRQDGREILRRVQWIARADGRTTVLENIADRTSFLPIRTTARNEDADPFVDLNFDGGRVSGRRMLLPHNATPADQIPAEFTLDLPDPVYDWRWWGLLVAAQPLDSGYTARFLAFTSEPPIGSPLVWVTARVVGEEAVGRIPCWVVEVNAGVPWTLWIAKDRDEAPVQQIRIDQPDGGALLWEPIAALQPAEPPPTFEIRPLTERVFAALVLPRPPHYAFANSLVVAGDSAVLVVDTQQSPSAARALIREIQRLTDLPVRWVVNTHWHADHVYGNGAYRASFPGVQFVAHRSLARDVLDAAGNYRDQELKSLPGSIADRERWLAEGRGPNGDTLTENGRHAVEYSLRLRRAYLEELRTLELVPPDVLVDDRLNLDLGGVSVQLVHLGPAHTAGDLAVILPEHGVVATGDLLEHAFPWLDGACLSGWAAALRRLRQTERIEHVVMSHGPVVDRAFLDLYSDLLHRIDRGIDLGPLRVPLAAAGVDTSGFDQKAQKARDLRANASVPPPLGQAPCPYLNGSPARNLSGPPPAHGLGAYLR